MYGLKQRFTLCYSHPYIITLIKQLKYLIYAEYFRNVVQVISSCLQMPSDIPLVDSCYQNYNIASVDKFISGGEITFMNTQQSCMFMCYKRAAQEIAY